MGGSAAKEKILTQVCIVIGQFCNGEAERQDYLKLHEHTILCLTHILTRVKLASHLAVKAMFALKQVCVHANSAKIIIQATIGRPLVQTFLDLTPKKSVDFYNQSTLLFQVLCQHRECAVELYKYGLTNAAIQQLLDSSKDTVINNAPDTQERIMNLAKMQETLDAQLI